MNNKYKLAFVGPKQIHTAFQTLDENWDFQEPVETLAELEEELNKENSKISEDTSIVILFSRLFFKEKELFADIVASLCPYSVVCVLIPQEDKKKYGNELERTIKETQIREAQQDDSYNSNTPFYFVDYENVHADIYSAIQDYVKSPIIDQEVRDSIKEIMGDSQELDIEELEDNQVVDLNEVILPNVPKGATGKVFTITSSKGGSGKSTVSIALGAFLAISSEQATIRGLTESPLKVCLVDLDTRDGQHWNLMGAIKPKTVMDILGNGGPTEVNIKDAIWHSDKTKCDYIFAPKRPRSAKEIPPQFYADLIQQLRGMYDVVILDTSVNYLDPLGEEVAFPLSDKIALVSDMGKSSILGCTRWILEEMYAEERGEKNIPPNKVGIVINKAMPDVAMDATKIEKAIRGLPILSMIPSDPELIVYASNVSELQQILKVDLIQRAIRDIAEAFMPEQSFVEIF